MLIFELLGSYPEPSNIKVVRGRISIRHVMLGVIINILYVLLSIDLIHVQIILSRMRLKYGIRTIRRDSNIYLVDAAAVGVVHS